jgi:uncharacterized membrane protein
MSERRFDASTLIRRDPGAVFEWVADYRNVPQVLRGVNRWEPLGVVTRGVGARFDAELTLLGIPLANELVLDTWDEPRAIAWHSESGVIAQRGEWRFERRPDGTEVTLTIAYRPPGGTAGGLVAQRVDGLVRQRLQAALSSMKKILETASGQP